MTTELQQKVRKCAEKIYSKAEPFDHWRLCPDENELEQIILHHFTPEEQTKEQSYTGHINCPQCGTSHWIGAECLSTQPTKSVDDIAEKYASTCFLIFKVKAAFDRGEECEWRHIFEKWNTMYKYTNLDYLFAADALLRIKPKAPTLRPWKPEEVPVGALIRLKSKPEKVAVILGYYNDGYFDRIIVSENIHLSESHYYIKDLFTYHGCSNDKVQYSIDHGKTWQPCGVLE